MTALPKSIGKPASRALAAKGITSLEGLENWRRAELLALHGVGPKAIGILEGLLPEHGLSFKPVD